MSSQNIPYKSRVLRQIVNGKFNKNITLADVVKKRSLYEKNNSVNAIHELNPLVGTTDQLTTKIKYDEKNNNINSIHELTPLVGINDQQVTKMKDDKKDNNMHIKPELKNLIIHTDEQTKIKHDENDRQITLLNLSNRISRLENQMVNLIIEFNNLRNNN